MVTGSYRRGMGVRHPHFFAAADFLATEMTLLASKIARTQTHERGGQMAFNRRILTAVYAAALVVAGAVAGVPATAVAGTAPSTADFAVVLAHPVYPVGCAGCGNGEA